MPENELTKRINALKDEGMDAKFLLVGNILIFMLWVLGVAGIGIYVVAVSPLFVGLLGTAIATKAVWNLWQIAALIRKVVSEVYGEK